MHVPSEAHARQLLESFRALPFGEVDRDVALDVYEDVRGYLSAARGDDAALRVYRDAAFHVLYNAKIRRALRYEITSTDHLPARYLTLRKDRLDVYARAFADNEVDAVEGIKVGVVIEPIAYSVEWETPPAPRRKSTPGADSPPCTPRHAKRVADDLCAIRESIDPEEALEVATQITEWIRATGREDLSTRFNYANGRAAVLYAGGLQRTVLWETGVPSSPFHGLPLEFVDISYRVVDEETRAAHEAGGRLELPGLTAWLELVLDDTIY